MSEELERLARQREALSADLALQRIEIARAARRLEPPLRRVERLRDDVRFFRERYVYLLLPVAVLAVLNPGTTLRLALGAWSAWSAFSRASGPPGARAAQALSALALRRR